MILADILPALQMHCGGHSLLAKAGFVPERRMMVEDVLVNAHRSCFPLQACVAIRVAVDLPVDRRLIFHRKASSFQRVPAAW